MPTSAKRRFAVDTSVAVPALDGAHAAHAVCAARVRTDRPALSGHAAFETFSVLTRLPGDLAIDPPTASRALATAFPEKCWLEPAALTDLFSTLGEVGIVGGAVYDALVGWAALTDGRVLLTRDQRARRTYDLLGVEYLVVR